MERELGVDAALAALTGTELQRLMAARGIGPPVESPLAGAVRVEPATPAAAPPPRKSSRLRKASTRAREVSSEEPPAPPKKRSRGAEREARRRAAKKAKLDEFNDLERRVAALADRVAELREELRARAATA